MLNVYWGFLFASSLFSMTLVPSGASKQTILEVPIYSEMQASLPWEGKKVPFYLTGAGVRTKKVVLLKVDVYVAASYLDQKGGISKQNPMQTISQSRGKAMVLTFLRDIDKEKIRETFTEALLNNDVDIQLPEVKKFLTGVQFDIKEKDQWVFLGYRMPEGSEMLLLETPKGKIEGKGKNLATQFWKMWFQKPIDNGVESLKEKLLNS